VRVLAYYPNLILLAAFLGLGLGCLRAGRRSLLWAWPVTLLALAVVAPLLGRVIFTQQSTSEHLFLLYYDLPRDAPVLADVRPPILGLFLLSALSFMPLGQFVAERFEELGRERSLDGYRADLMGSLAGVVLFTGLSFARLFPVWWFVVLLGAALPLFGGRRRALIYLLAAAALVALVGRAERAQQYSPYYALTLTSSWDGFSVLTNGSLHQTATRLRRDEPVAPAAVTVREGYHAPYRLLGRPPRRALVVGAGTGNDVAVLLDEGAEQVDAVEIDPVILEIGQAWHPDQPYGSSRVRRRVTDARTFLENSREQYDVIVFGTLDSMTRLSALSTVRLDNFVYTMECLRAAQRRLTPDGALVLYFMVSARYIDIRLGGMLTSVFGQTPLVDETNRSLFNRVYMAGPGYDAVQGQERRAAAGPALAATRWLELPSDDWPYLYLARRGLSAFYWSMMALLGAIALVGVVAVSPEMRRSLRLASVDGEMLLLGLGFLLLETRSVTQMNLAWGATWLTSAVVFASVLLTVLASALLVQRRRLPVPVASTGVIVSLLVAYLVPPSVLLTSSLVPRLVLSLLLAGGPVLFGSALFAAAFARRDQPALAFGWNLLGAVLGGLLEMLSMAIGLRALLLLALASYLGAMLPGLRRDRPPSTVAPA
jgi:spermidine synthase